MPNLYLPITALILSIVLIVIYYSKQRVNLFENKLYSIMLFAVLFDSIMVSSLFINVYTNYNELLVKMLNKIDYLFLIIWASSLLIYIFTITYNKVIDFKKKLKLFSTLVIIVDVIVYIIVCNADIEIVLQDIIHQTAQGPAVNISIAICLVYVIVALFIVLMNRKRISRKHIPVFIIIITAIAIAFLFSINPFLICISLGLTIDNLVMYFTIENPDRKVIEEIEKNRELVETNIEDKSNMLFKVSEDVRTPLRKIKALNNSILVNEHLDDIKETSRTIDVITNDLINSIDSVLDVSNIDKSKIRFFDTSYSVYKLFNQIVYLIKNRADGKFDFKYSINSTIPEKLYGDSAKIKQIICSLLLQFKDKENGVVDLDINSIVRYDVCRLIITIRDTNYGMDLAEINSILESDTNISEEEFDNIDNLEIDIRIAKKIIDLMGGILLIKSDADRGITYIVVLNQLIEEDKKEENINKYVRLLSNKKRVLLVDDEYRELEKIANELRKNNFEVISLMYGKDCIDRISNGEKYDYIFIDDEMKKYNAVTIIKELKKLDLGKTKVFVMLNKDKEAIKEHYLEDYPFTDYLLKDTYQEEIKRIKEKF